MQRKDFSYRQRKSWLLRTNRVYLYKRERSFEFSRFPPEKFCFRFGRDLLTTPKNKTGKANTFRMNNPKVYNLQYTKNSFLQVRMYYCINPMLSPRIDTARIMTYLTYEIDVISSLDNEFATSLVSHLHFESFKRMWLNNKSKYQNHALNTLFENLKCVQESVYVIGCIKATPYLRELTLRLEFRELSI